MFIANVLLTGLAARYYGRMRFSGPLVENALVTLTPTFEATVTEVVPAEIDEHAPTVRMRIEAHVEADAETTCMLAAGFGVLKN